MVVLADLHIAEEWATMFCALQVLLELAIRRMFSIFSIGLD